MYRCMQSGWCRACCYAWRSWEDRKIGTAFRQRLCLGGQEKWRPTLGKAEPEYLYDRLATYSDGFRRSLLTGVQAEKNAGRSACSEGKATTLCTFVDNHTAVVDLASPVKLRLAIPWEHCSPRGQKVEARDCGNFKAWKT